MENSHVVFTTEERRIRQLSVPFCDSHPYLLASSQKIGFFDRIYKITILEDSTYVYNAYSKNTTVPPGICSFKLTVNERASNISDIYIYKKKKVIVMTGLIESMYNANKSNQLQLNTLLSIDVFQYILMYSNVYLIFFYLFSDDIG